MSQETKKYSFKNKILSFIKKKFKIFNWFINTFNCFIIYLYFLHKFAKKS